MTTVSEPILVDGLLDEPAWQSSPQIGSLIQRIPTEGAAPSERTEVTLLRDADNLCIGVMCHESEPDRVLASQMARDASLRPDDYVELLLDTFRDQSNAYYFSTRLFRVDGGDAVVWRDARHRLVRSDSGYRESLGGDGRRAAA